MTRSITATRGTAARLERGARHVQAGVGLAAIGLATYATATIVDHGLWRLRMIGAVAGFAIMAVGVLAGSWLARAAMLFAAFGFAFVLPELPGHLDRWRLGYGGYPPWYVAMHGTGVVAFIAGTVLANVTPAALAHHADRRAARKARRRARSLADWRAAAWGDDVTR
jgi:hypothetical protein